MESSKKELQDSLSSLGDYIEKQLDILGDYIEDVFTGKGTFLVYKDIRKFYQKRYEEFKDYLNEELKKGNKDWQQLVEIAKVVDIQTDIAREVFEKELGEERVEYILRYVNDVSSMLKKDIKSVIRKG